MVRPELLVELREVHAVLLELEPQLGEVEIRDTRNITAVRDQRLAVHRRLVGEVAVEADEFAAEEEPPGDRQEHVPLVRCHLVGGRDLRHELVALGVHAHLGHGEHDDQGHEQPERHAACGCRRGERERGNRETQDEDRRVHGLQDAVLRRPVGEPDGQEDDRQTVQVDEILCLELASRHPGIRDEGQRRQRAGVHPLRDPECHRVEELHVVGEVPDEDEQQDAQLGIAEVRDHLAELLAQRIGTLARRLLEEEQREEEHHRHVAGVDVEQRVPAAPQHRTRGRVQTRPERTGNDRPEESADVHDSVEDAEADRRLLLVTAGHLTDRRRDHGLEHAGAQGDEHEVGEEGPVPGRQAAEVVPRTQHHERRQQHALVPDLLADGARDEW